MGLLQQRLIDDLLRWIHEIIQVTNLQFDLVILLLYYPSVYDLCLFVVYGEAGEQGFELLVLHHIGKLALLS